MQRNQMTPLEFFLSALRDGIRNFDPNANDPNFIPVELPNRRIISIRRDLLENLTTLFLSFTPQTSFNSGRHIGGRGLYEFARDLAQVDIRIQQEQRRRPEQPGTTLEQILPQDGANEEKILRNLGAVDEDIAPLLCPIGAHIIVVPVKVKAVGGVWHYFEKELLENELKVSSIDPETNLPKRNDPLTNMPIADDEPLDAKDFIQDKLNFINRFIKEGLSILGVTPEQIQRFYLENEDSLKSKEFTQDLPELIKMLYTCRILSLNATENEIADLFCPLGKRIIFDSVKLKDKRKNKWIYFERAMLEQALKNKPGINPITNEPLEQNEQPREAPELTEKLWKLIKTKNEKTNQTDEKLAEVNNVEKDIWEQNKKDEYTLNNQSQLRKKICAKNFIPALLDEIEDLTKDPNNHTPQRKEFRDSLEKLAENLNDDLFCEEWRLANIPGVDSDWDSIQQSIYGKLAQYTIDMLKELKKSKAVGQTDEAYKKDKIDILYQYEKNCKKIIVADKTILKLLAMVCIAAVGFVVGVIIGMVIGMAAGVWLGPGAFVTAAFGAVAGGVKGAAIGVLVTASIFGLGAAAVSGAGMFKPKKQLEEVKRSLDVAEAGKNYIKQRIK